MAKDPPPDLRAALNALPKYNPREEMRRALQSIIAGAGVTDMPPDDVERRMLREVLGSHTQQPPTPPTTSRPNGGSSRHHHHHHQAAGMPRAPQDTLIACLSSRLAKAEVLARALHNQLSKRSRQLSDAKRQNALLLQALEETRVSGDVMQGLCELERENASLRSQLHEIETFLSDYGLVWVGSSHGDNACSSAEPSLLGDETTAENDDEPLHRPRATTAAAAATSTSIVATPPPARPLVDVVRLMNGIKELNRLMQMEGDLSATTKAAGRQGEFKSTSSLPIIIFANGIFIQRGPFRPFTDSATKVFVQDIMDGYFPYELKEYYPDGVRFQVTDRSGEEHKPFVPFTGEGTVVGCPRVRTMQCLKDRQTNHQQHLLLPLSRDEFFNRLPGQVIRDGKVIPVRDGVLKTLLGPGSGAATTTTTTTKVLETPTLQLIKDRSRVHLAADEQQQQRQESPPQDIATLRVHSSDGRRSYLLKMRFDSTCLELYSYCDKGAFMPAGPPPVYELRTRYPNRSLPRSAEQTLEELGLIPNATLLIREIGGKSSRTEKGES